MARQNMQSIPIQFFTISRRNHSKWFCCYINHTSGHALTLKQTMNCPLIPDSYHFLLPNSKLCTKISLHKRCACAVSQMRSPKKLIEYSFIRSRFNRNSSTNSTGFGILIGRASSDSHTLINMHTHNSIQNGAVH